MIIAYLTDQLGNQMFTYASVKCMALRKGYGFGFHRIKPAYGLNSSHAQYGAGIREIFALPDEESVCDIPGDYGEYYERPVGDRKRPDYSELVLSEIYDNCVLKGHFATTVFFSDRLDLVRSWFSFPQEIKEYASDYVNGLRTNNPGRVIVSVHFRVGKDYVRNGYKLSRSYWDDASDYVISHFAKSGTDVKFVVLYDTKTKEVDRYIKKYHADHLHGSMIEDMCIISKCDGNIICNSTFSSMSALLNSGSALTVCPTRFPSEAGDYPMSIFLPEWTRIGTGRRSVLSELYYLKRRLWMVIKRS